MSTGDRSTGHERIDYDFKYERFDYDTPIKFQPSIKIQFFFTKPPDMSWEHFFKHFATVHADMTVAAKDFGLFKIQRYTQQHQTPEMRSRLRNLGMDLLEADACSTLWVRNWDDVEGFFKSPRRASLSADCAHFMDLSKGIQVFAGPELICFGKGIPDLDDSDGVTEYLQMEDDEGKAE